MFFWNSSKRLLNSYVGLVKKQDKVILQQVKTIECLTKDVEKLKNYIASKLRS